jgi:hypothetical protein
VGVSEPGSSHPLHFPYLILGVYRAEEDTKQKERKSERGRSQGSTMDFYAPRHQHYGNYEPCPGGIHCMAGFVQQRLGGRDFMGFAFRSIDLGYLLWQFIYYAIFTKIAILLD